ncbi:MAG: hypothetical protein LBC71_08010 [Oscillospiraceae bacterium]|jgi:hypothetical protein|nr:hypothetical protein [Oscillospiraceae bacterium]
MNLRIIESKTAKNELAVDLTRFECDKETMLIEFAKITAETNEDKVDEIEIRSRVRIPIELALPMFGALLDSLVAYENEYNNGYGLSLTDEEK